MRKMKSASTSICESRKIAMPDEINPHGTLFGGVMMSWIDKVAYMCAQNYAEWKKTVTANIDQIQFHRPVFAGDHVILKAFVAHVGKSSMEIDVHVFKEDPTLKERISVADAYLTFVAVNASGKGKIVPELKLETHEDFTRNSKANIRIQARKHLREKLLEVSQTPNSITMDNSVKSAAKKFLYQKLKKYGANENWLRLILT